MMGRKTTGIILLIVFLAGIISLVFYFKFRANDEKRKISWQILRNKIEEEVATFRGEAGIIIKDLNRNRQISLNPDKLFPAASLVKLPIAVCSFYAADEGKIAHGGGIKLPEMQELIEQMICASDNTSTNILIEQLGFGYLNDCFKKLGLKQTNLSRQMLDFKSRKIGKENYTSCQDIAFLLEEIYYKKLISRSVSRQCLGLLSRQIIRDRIPVRLPSDTVVAHKTGLEKGVCHDAGIIFSHQGDFLVCVLTRHNQKTAKSAKEFISQIAHLVYSCYQR